IADRAAEEAAGEALALLGRRRRHPSSVRARFVHGASIGRRLRSRQGRRKGEVDGTIAKWCKPPCPTGRPAFTLELKPAAAQAPPSEQEV
ncbi:MAG TPA: hypothetical protein VKV26_24360, partial [Dehalococcoidia bacterium]|nr:hypothetical protein [Dehalococcoidia bacterium]